MAPVVTVAVCTRNGGARAVRSLRAILASAAALNLDVEVLAVDNGSTDDTPDLLATLSAAEPTLRVVTEPTAGLSRARNKALETAAGTIIAFTDDDCMPERAWLTRLTSPLISGEHDIAAGAVHLAPELVRPWLAPLQLDLLASTRDGLGQPPRAVIGANMAYRRSAIADRRFDVRLGAGAALGAMEETLMYEQLRAAGSSAVFVPDAIVVHHFEPDRLEPKSFLARAYLQGRGEGWMQWNWYAAGDTFRGHLRWMRTELRLVRRGGRRRLHGSVGDLELVRVLGHRRAYAYSRWIARDKPLRPTPTEEQAPL